MSSKAQKRKGYPLPENEWEEESQSFCIVIPEGQEWEMAMRAQLYELGKYWMWKRDDDRPRAATDSATTWRSILQITEDCNGGGDVATKEDIRDGIYEAANRIALQIATGQYANIGLSTDEDGTVTQTPEGGEPAELPEDDPLTLINEELSAKDGGCINTRLMINALLKDMADWFFAGATQAMTKQRLILLYKLEAGGNLDAFVNHYYVIFPAPAVAIVCTALLATDFFCRGVVVTSFTYYALKEHVNANEKETLLMLAPCLTDELITEWYNAGIDTPSTIYKDYNCYPIPDFVINNLVYGTAQFSTQQKAFHRLTVTVEGYYVDPDGDVQDLFWVRSNAGVFTFTASSNTVVYGTGITLPTTSQVPYRSDHKYQFTIDIPSLDGGFFSWQINRHASMAVASASPSGGFQFTFHDNGRYAV